MANNEPDDGHSRLDKGRGNPLAYATDYHAPVLCKDVVDGLLWKPAGLYVDATLGGGGHAAAILDVLDAGGRVIGIDQDADALEAAGERLKPHLESGRLRIVRGNFAELLPLMAGIGVSRVDGLLLDLGVSSHQIDTPERGFSYSATGRLDMRMNTAADLDAGALVNSWPEERLRAALREFGEEPRARRIAQEIVRTRPLRTTEELAGVIRRVVPSREAQKILSRIFQALRIAVNRELEVLEEVLFAAQRMLVPSGRIAVISYHSLEDRRVKRFLRYGNFEGRPERDVYGNLLAPFRELTRHPIQPDEKEVEVNPRARSARLRIAERTDGGSHERKEDGGHEIA